jgi:hypothetical protein
VLLIRGVTVASASERKARDIEELNLALGVLREQANKEGYVKGSPVELIYTALTKRGKEISLSRVRDLVTLLGELGWREEAWIGPKNVRGSRIVMRPQRIKNLETLPAKVERERFEKEVAAWARDIRAFSVTTWTITNPHKHNQSTTIIITGYDLVKPRGQKYHWAFRLDGFEQQPQWLKSMLTSDNKLADSTLYTLWKDGNAHLRPDNSN